MTNTFGNGLLELIKSDLFRYNGRIGILCFFKTFVLVPGFRYSFWWRVASSLNTFVTGNIMKKAAGGGIFLIIRLIYRRYCYRFGIEIPLGTKIGKGLRINHFTGIIINGKTVIGKNFTIQQGANVVAGRYGDCPIIGDNVYISAGGVIIGGRSIGSGVVIGANAVVTHDLPENAVAAGVPAKIMSYSGSGDFVINTVE